MDFFSKQIGIQEYDSIAVSTKYRRCNPLPTRYEDLKLNLGRLTVAVAKTILTRNPGAFRLLPEIPISLLNISTIVSPMKNELRLHNNFRNTFRDFSKKSRIGEFAQGISFLFAQDILGYPVILDYEGYLDLNNIQYKDEQKKPDFVLTLRNNAGISFMESKGICMNKKANNIKTELQGALKQCDFGKANVQNSKKNIQINRCYATAVEFAEATDAWNSCLYFTDPSSNSNFQDQLNFLKLLRYYYAAWFLYGGEFQEAYNLLRNQPLERSKRYRIRTYEEEEYFVLNSPFMISLPYWNYFYPFYNNFEIGIAEKVFRLLNYESELDARDSYLNLKILPISNEDVELFRDGTILFYK